MRTSHSEYEGTVVAYLARGGVDDDGKGAFSRFVSSYLRYDAGVSHDLVVIFKGFATEDLLARARMVFAPLAPAEIHTDDARFDLGAYADAAMQLDCRRVCFLNTNSEIMSSNWLAKLVANLERPGVGLVGATGSFETGVGGLPFPNVHLRTNAFMMQLPLARRILSSLDFRTKFDAHVAEHGRNSITRQVVSHGLAPVVVGANGRGYAPEWWASSRTFRQGEQANLLVHDNQTRAFEAMSWSTKKAVFAETWGASRVPGSPFLYAT